MTTIVAFLGVTRLTDVGYALYSLAGLPLGNRTTAGVIATGGGYYQATINLPATAESVIWDSPSTPGAVAREDFRDPVGSFPPPSTDITKCVVYGALDFISADSAPICVSFTLQKPQAGAAGNYLVAGATQRISLTPGATFTYELPRNDALQPPGSSYLVKCEQLFAAPKTVTLNAPLFDLRTILP